MERAGRRVALVLVTVVVAAGWLRDGDGALAAGAAGGEGAGTAGALSGVYDALIYDFTNINIGHCIALIDHDGGSNAIAALSQCYLDQDQDDPNGEPLEPLPGEGPDGAPGLPPPPPYNLQPPATGAGAYDPTPQESFEVTSCFRDLGGSLGPNALVATTVFLPEQQLAANGKMSGGVLIYPRQGSAQCQANVPEGTPMKPWQIDLYPVEDVNGIGPNSPAPWRTLGDDDFDNDGCSDADELMAVASCGDDPYSPLDLPPAGTDVSGSYILTATVAEADVCWNGTYGVAATPCAGGDGSLVPGTYHQCVLDVQQAGVALTGRTYCYVDSTSTAVNPQVAIPAGSKACPPAAAQYCGDGLLGSAPPGRTLDPSGQINFGDIDDKHAVLTGQLDSGVITLSGCVEDRDGMAALGHVHLSLAVDAHTGQGSVTVAPNQTQQDCLAGTPAGAPVPVPASLARQATTVQQRDTDGDGCPNQAELSDNQVAGGLRDPSNHYDYMEATQNGQVRIPDIVAVVGQYFIDDLPGPIDMNSLTDRTVITGGNPWNVGPPNGQQRIDDILLQIKQYFHDC